MYREHRQALLGRMEPGSVAVFPAAPHQSRNSDVHYAYRQHSDLFYLTGFREPEAVAVLLRPETGAPQLVMFCRPRHREREIWDGKRAGVEGAVSQYGADRAHPIEELETRLPGYLENQRTLYYRLGENLPFDAQLVTALNNIRRRARSAVRPPARLVDPAALLHELRLIKDGEELDLMRRAAGITAAAHREAMQLARPGMNECEVQALVEYHFRRHGAEPGYGSIIAGGANAATLHYVDNRDPLKNGELLLIDAGAELGCYTADITRTFPLGRRFSVPQREIYEVVLEAQTRAIAKCRPGNRINDVHDTAVRALAEGMIHLGLLSGSLDEVLAKEDYRRFYMHRTSHWLGLDVHDVGAYFEDGTSEPRVFRPGMVLTVEPGFYVASDLEVAGDFRGIGVRIEDDVLITAGDPDILTSGVPRTVSEIEALRPTE
jgi:Xaa-Pro aminopeptidase